jgi:glycosyltransferase involved in cell wall biosynthesis
MADEIRALGIPVDLLPVWHLRDLTAIPRLRAYLWHVKADLVHTQLEFADVLGNLSAKLLGLPSVSTLHTMPAQDMGIKLKFHQEVEMFSLRHFCDTVIAVSEEARGFYLKIGRLAPDKLQTIYNGIDLTNFSGLDRDGELSAVRGEFAIPVAANILITVAVLRELKGIQFMLRALPAVLAKHPNTYYLIVGSGEHRDELEKEASRAGVNRRVIFSGRRSDIPRLLLASDLFVLPTLTEALPTVLAEAMAAQLPIVACAVGGVPEMVTDGQNGLLVPPAAQQALADACNALLADLQQSRRMGKAGWQLVNRKFNIQTQVEQLKNLYLRLIGTYGK